MLQNEIFALSCRAYYDEQGLIVDKTNGEFAHCPYPKGMGETGYYLLHEHHQQQGILQSEDVGQCCFFGGDAKKWLLTCNPFPDNYFELWDIYEKYHSLNSRKGGKAGGKAAHLEKDENGKSINAVKAGKVGAKAAHLEKDENGKSTNAVKAGKASKAEKDENGKSINAVKAGEASKAEKDENGKSINAVKAGKAGGKATHAEKDENGKSINAVKAGKVGAKAAHLEKDENGKSINAVKRGQATKLKTQKRTEVININDGKVFIFDSTMDASRTLNLNRRHLSAVCTGKRKSTGGYTARYI